jgi:hypothetical protein
MLYQLSYSHRVQWRQFTVVLQVVNNGYANGGI